MSEQFLRWYIHSGVKVIKKILEETHILADKGEFKNIKPDLVYSYLEWPQTQNTLITSNAIHVHKYPETEAKLTLVLCDNLSRDKNRKTAWIKLPAGRAQRQ